MVTMNDVPINDLINKMGEELKNVKEIEAPTWSVFCKTGAHKEKPPVNEDWWFVRAAAILKSVQKLGPVGVSKLRTKYGGKKNRGHQPEKFVRGSGSIARKALQQLEKAGLIKQTAVGVHKGRIATPEGIKLINKCAKSVAK